MKSATPELIALLNSGDFVRIGLWTITLNGGQILRYTSSDFDVYWQSQRYVAGPLIDCESIVEKVGLEVAVLEAEITANSDMDQVNGVPLIRFISRGGLRAAKVKYDVAFAPSYGVPITGIVNRFLGRVTSISEVYGNVAKISVSSELILLNTSFPPDVYQAPCLRTVYDSGCGLNKDAWKVTSSVYSGGDTDFVVNATNATGWFDQGTIRFTSGPNNGLTRSIRASVLSSGRNSVKLTFPLPVPCTPGDTVELIPGCDLTMATCKNKFSNINRFRGYPFVPVPEAAV